MKIFILFAICKMFFVLAIFTTENRTDRASFIMCLLKISLLESNLFMCFAPAFSGTKFSATALPVCRVAWFTLSEYFVFFSPKREKSVLHE